MEQAIQEQLYNLMAGKTVIAIAHRLSTIAAMDRLVIMDKGRIVEQGTHEELIRRRALRRAVGAPVRRLPGRAGGGGVVMDCGRRPGPTDRVPLAAMPRIGKHWQTRSQNLFMIQSRV